MVSLYTTGFAQVASFNSKLEDLEAHTRVRNNEYIISMVDQLLKNPQLTATQSAILKTYKIEALVDSQFFDEAQQLANILEENIDLPPKYKVRVWIQQALVYEIIGKYVQSLRKLALVERYYDTKPKDRYYGVFLYRKSSLFRITGKKKEAFYLAHQAKDFGCAYDYKNVIGTAHILISFLIDENEYELKIKNLELAKENFLALKDYNSVNYILISIAKINATLKNYDQTANALYQANYNQKKYGSDSIFIEVLYTQLGNFHERQGKLDSALYYTRKASKLSEAIIINKQRINIHKLEAEQERMRRQFDVEKVSEDLRKSKKERLQLFVVVICFGIILLLIVYLLYNLTNKNKEIDKQRRAIQKSNSQLQISLSEKNVLLQELNHRVKNNLSLILSLTTFHIQDSDDPQTAQKFQDLEHRIKAIATTHEHFIYSDALDLDSKISLQSYLEKIVESSIAVSNKPIEYSLDVAAIQINMDTILPIGILINELVSNTIKYAKNHDNLIIITLTASLANGQLLLIYKDSGINFKDTKNNKGLGMFIIESMVQQLAGSYTRHKSEYTFNLFLK